MADARIALVTGAGQRIGAAIATRLAGEGFRVAIHFRDSETEARELVQQLKKNGGCAAAVDCDLGKEEDLRDVLPRIERQFDGPVSFLVNNASIYLADDVATATRESWQRHMDVNLYAPFVLAQELAERLPADRTAHIVNIIDQRIVNPTSEFLSYTVSKSSLWTLTCLLAESLAPRIRVNAIGPGPTLQSAYQSAEEFAREQSRVPLGRGPKPEEIAEAVMLLERLPSVTGAFLPVDGGQHLVRETGSDSKERQDDRP